MATRCNVHFMEDGEIVANVFVFLNGFPYGPDGMGADFHKFFTKCDKLETSQSADSGAFYFSADYLATKYVVYKARQDNKFTRTRVMSTAPETEADKKGRKHYLNFMSVGIVSCDLSDSAFVYEVDCTHRTKSGRPTVRGWEVIRILDGPNERGVEVGVKIAPRSEQEERLVVLQKPRVGLQVRTEEELEDEGRGLIIPEGTLGTIVQSPPDGDFKVKFDPQPNLSEINLTWTFYDYDFKQGRLTVLSGDEAEEVLGV